MWLSSGFVAMTGGQALMLLVSFVLIYCAVVKKWEPLLLVPIAFGVLLANLPVTGITDPGCEINPPGLLHVFNLGIKMVIFPPLIFLGVGAMTDFGPLIARPSAMFIGAGAQFGITAAFMMGIMFGFSPGEAASIGIIGGADGPTAIFLTARLAPHLLAAVAIAAYTYMALIPMIQPPFMRLMTTKEEREIVMTQLRHVSKMEKILFPVIVTVVSVLLLPSVAPLVGMLMLGNLFRESGVVERLSDTAQNSLINTVTIFLGLGVGGTAAAQDFLRAETLIIIVLGLAAFIFGTIGGLFIAKLMCKMTGGKINPLIGSAGVSAVPMAARVSQLEGQRANKGNFLLMHAMGPNVAGVLGSAIAAGVFLSLFG